MTSAERYVSAICSAAAAAAAARRMQSGLCSATLSGAAAWVQPAASSWCDWSTKRAAPTGLDRAKRPLGHGSGGIKASLQRGERASCMRHDKSKVRMSGPGSLAIDFGPMLCAGPSESCVAANALLPFETRRPARQRRIAGGCAAAAGGLETNPSWHLA